ncbi:uncharacterized protein LOC131882315 isoform X2 [Tigriopus californicus]|uniref:uncharacterized protein LOC131882315 isoform X2 n=1 Tax=Tigriopus californicus TaxID=6832 RepID=UPI0027D9F4B4|nr:uncharacterized protein LOC131882315 isoform X2 [Tigriopus californicus]
MASIRVSEFRGFLGFIHQGYPHPSRPHTSEEGGLGTIRLGRFVDLASNRGGSPLVFGQTSGSSGPGQTKGLETSGVYGERAHHFDPNGANSAHPVQQSPGTPGPRTSRCSLNGCASVPEAIFPLPSDRVPDQKPMCTFLMDPTEVEERFLRENFPAFTTDPLSPEENNVLIKRLKFVLKCLGWSSRDVMRNLTELAVATKRERRMLGRFILAAYVGRPLLHYRPLSQIVKAILILTHTHKVADIRQRDLAAIQSSISANKRKGWSALRKHFNVVRLVKDKQIKAANSRDMLQEEMKIVFLTVMRHINTTDLTNIDHKDVPMPLLAEVTNRNSFKRATFAKLLGRLKRLKNGVDAQSHFHNQRDILQAVIAQGATKPTEIDWRPIENGFPSYTRGCLMSVLYHSMKPGDGQTIREQWLASYQRRLQQTYKNSRFSATYNKDMEQLKEAYQWAKEAFEQDDKAKISIPKEDGSL